MSDNPYATPPEAPQGTPARRGSRLWLGFGLGCGCIVVLCCGGGAGMVYYFSQSVSEDPTEIRNVANEIAVMDIPPSLQPRMSVDFGIPFWGKVVMLAMFAETDGQGILILAEVPKLPYDESQKDEVRAEMDKQLAQQNQDIPDIVVTASRDVDLNIRGKDVTMTIETGKPRNSDTEFVRAGGVFPGKTGTAMILLQVPKANHNEDDVEAIVRSIR